jgi:integrase
MGRNPNDSRQRVRDFARTWLDDVVRPKRRPRTVEFYTRHVGYATTYIGDLPLELPDEQTIERCLSKIAADGLSARSVDHVRAVLHNMFNVAKRWHLRDDNPVALVPHWDTPPTKEKALTPLQVAILLGAIKGDRLECLYHLALTLGLRRGELLGLSWADVDFEHSLITVRQQVTEDEHRKIILAPYVKSDEGYRELPVPPDLLAMLRKRREEAIAEARIVQKRAAELAERKGEPTPLVLWNTDDLVFCSEAGTMILPHNFNRRFAKLIRTINKELKDQDAPAASMLPSNTSPHTLRHTALTDLAAHGEAKAVQNIAGHADIETTMHLYAGRRMQAMRDAVEKMEKARAKKTG